ncbi:hypothetical protein P7K49_037077, partial [Saguinus oedipus]
MAALGLGVSPSGQGPADWLGGTLVRSSGPSSHLMAHPHWGTWDTVPALPQQCPHFRCGGTTGPAPGATSKADLSPPARGRTWCSVIRSQQSGVAPGPAGTVGRGHHAQCGHLSAFTPGRSQHFLAEHCVCVDEKPPYEGGSRRGNRITHPVYRCRKGGNGTGTTSVPMFVPVTSELRSMLSLARLPVSVEWPHHSQATS